RISLPGLGLGHCLAGHLRVEYTVALSTFDRWRVVDIIRTESVVYQMSSPSTVSPESSVDRIPAPAVLDLIGRTPLVRLHRFERELPPGVELYAKAEWQNPGGSVKDRAAARMILEGE